MSFVTSDLSVVMDLEECCHSVRVTLSPAWVPALEASSFEAVSLELSVVS